MPYAVTLRLDADAAGAVAGMWAALAAAGVSDDAIRLGYPAHVTLAVLPDGAREGRLLAAAARLAGVWRPLRVDLAALGLFPGTPAVLFLAPVPSPDLLARHAALLDALAGEPVHAHYGAGAWLPHVTLAGDLADPAAALAALAPVPLPIAAVLDTLEVVRFRPPHVLASHPLTPA